MPRILLSSLYVLVLWIGCAQASDLFETEGSPVPTQLLEKHLNHPLHFEDIVHIRRELGEHILKITEAQTSPQTGWARMYLDNIADPTQPCYISQAMAKQIQIGRASCWA